jgi:hypothetical protein
MGPGLATVGAAMRVEPLSTVPNVSGTLPEVGADSTCIWSDMGMESWMEPTLCFSLAPRASRATCELFCSDAFSDSCGRSIGPSVGAVLDIWGKDSLDLETCSPALAMEVKLESCFDGFRKSGGLEMSELGGPDKGLEMATGSLVDCVNAAMDNRRFLPAGNG